MKRYSIRYQLFFYTGFFVIVMLVCMSLGNAYAISLVRNQVYESNKNTIYLYLKQIERGLDDVEVYLFSVATYNSELKTMSGSKDKSERLLASYELNNYFYRNLQLYPAADTFFAYSPLDKQYVFSGDKAENWQQQEGLRKRIVETAEEAVEGAELPYGWTAEKIGDEYYFVKYTRAEQLIIGAWVSTQALLKNISTIEIPGLEHILFLDQKGDPVSADPFFEEEAIEFIPDSDNYYLTGRERQYLVIGEKSDNGFQLTALLKDSEILEGLGTLRALIFLLAVGAGIGGLLFLWFTRKKIAVPLKNLVNAMLSIQQGSLDVRLEEHGVKNEFALVNKTFNSMTEEITNLKINIYEEKIQRQKAQLDFYALQVNPHFLINLMNTIYNFARMGESKLIQEFTACITRHFRYTLYGDGKVLLKDEVEFTRNFLEMQRLRSFNQTEFEMKVWMEPGMETVTVPNLLLQGFVENSVKHTKADKGIVLVEIQAFQEKGEKGSYINIRVQDSGSGFEPEVLKILNAGEKLVDERGKHIGIYNIRQRLYLLYGDEVELTFENRKPCGARVCVRFFQPWEE